MKTILTRDGDETKGPQFAETIAGVVVRAGYVGAGLADAAVETLTSGYSDVYWDEFAINCCDPATAVPYDYEEFSSIDIVAYSD